LAVLEEAGAVEDPRPRPRHPRHLGERVARGGEPHRVVVPRRFRDEVLETLMRGVHVRGACAGTGGDRFHAFAIAVTDQAEGIAGEVIAPLRCAQPGADAVEVVAESLLGLDVHEVDLITPRSPPQLRREPAAQPIGMIRLWRSRPRPEPPDAVVLTGTSFLLRRWASINSRRPM